MWVGTEFEFETMFYRGIEDNYMTSVYLVGCTENFLLVAKSLPLEDAYIQAEGICGRLVEQQVKEEVENDPAGGLVELVFSDVEDVSGADIADIFENSRATLFGARRT